MIKLLILIIFQSFTDCPLIVEVRQNGGLVEKIWIDNNRRFGRVIEVNGNQPVQFFVHGSSCKFQDYKIPDGIQTQGRKKIEVIIESDPKFSVVH